MYTLRGVIVIFMFSLMGICLLYLVCSIVSLALVRNKMCSCYLKKNDVRVCLFIPFPFWAIVLMFLLNKTHRNSSKKKKQKRLKMPSTPLFPLLFFIVYLSKRRSGMLPINRRKFTFNFI